MAHLGKSFPNRPFRELIGYRWPDTFVPRKWKITYHSADAFWGSIWSGEAILSDVGEDASDRQSINYTFTHSTDPTNEFIKMNWSLVENTTTSPITYYAHRMTWELYHLAVLRATVTFNWIRSFGPWDLQFDALQNIGWSPPNFIPPGGGQNLDFKWRYGTWAEQPEYHPYRR